MAGERILKTCRKGPVHRMIAYDEAEGNHVLVRRIGGIVKNPAHQHDILQIGRKQLPDQRAIHIEGGDAVCRRDVVGRRLVRHSANILDQRIQRRGIRIPMGKGCLTIAFRACPTAAQQHGNKQYKANDSLHVQGSSCFRERLSSVRFLRRQKRLAHDRMDQIRDQRPKAYIREKMIGHVDAVIAIERHEGTGEDARRVSVLHADIKVFFADIPQMPLPIFRKTLLYPVINGLLYTVLMRHSFQRRPVRTQHRTSLLNHPPYLRLRG